MGGGVDNRASLADAVLWKDNHWAVLAARRATLAEALALAPPGVPVIVEVENEAQLDEAPAAGVRHVLADNLSIGALTHSAPAVPMRCEMAIET